MFKKTVVSAAMAFALMGAVPAVSVASHGGGSGGGGGTTSGSGGGGGGGGGGGTPAPVLPTPAIAPGTFDGIGPGPVYIHDSFGDAQRTRYAQDGSIRDVVQKPEINGIRAEYPNNRTETWIGTSTSGAASWRITCCGVGSGIDRFEPYTPLQDSPTLGYLDGGLGLAGADDGTDSRPDALLPFPAPTDSAFTVSGDIANFVSKTAIGFSDSSATDHNFESNGQAWLELQGTGVTETNPGVVRWTFHTDGSSGATLSGSYVAGTDLSRAAVSYDPVAHVAAATIDGNLVASVPYAAQQITYVGVEGSMSANVNNFTVRAGTVNDPPPASVAPPATPATSQS